MDIDPTMENRYPCFFVPTKRRSRAGARLGIPKVKIQRIREFKYRARRPICVADPCDFGATPDY